MSAALPRLCPRVSGNIRNFNQAVSRHKSIRIEIKGRVGDQQAWCSATVFTSSDQNTFSLSITLELQQNGYIWVQDDLE